MSKEKAAISQKEILVLACERQREIVDAYDREVNKTREQCGDNSMLTEQVLGYWRREHQKLGELQQMLQQEYSKEIPSAWGIR